MVLTESSVDEDVVGDEEEPAVPEGANERAT